MRQLKSAFAALAVTGALVGGGAALGKRGLDQHHHQRSDDDVAEHE